MWRLLALGAFILVYRWSLRLSTPKADLWLAEEVTHQTLVATRRRLNMIRVWCIGLARYVPTKRVQASWESLKRAYTTGAYGEAGT